MTLLEIALERLRKQIFITKTMSIEYNETTNTDKIEEINKSIYSLFEDDSLAAEFIKTIAVSSFTTKFEKLHTITGNGRNGKSLIMGF